MVHQSNGELTVVESMGTTQENNQTIGFASPLMIKGSYAAGSPPHRDLSKFSPAGK